jgi:hypothetical protein
LSCGASTNFTGGLFVGENALVTGAMGSMIYTRTFHPYSFRFQLPLIFASSLYVSSAVLVLSNGASLIAGDIRISPTLGDRRGLLMIHNDASLLTRTYESTIFVETSDIIINGGNGPILWNRILLGSNVALQLNDIKRVRCRRCMTCFIIGCVDMRAHLFVCLSVCDA